MSTLHWFRLYHRMIDDEKIRLIAFEDRWHFIAVCCLKADGLLDEPDSPLKWRKVAVKMGVQSRDLDEIRRRLVEVGLVDDDMQPRAWDELQYRSDTSTERVRNYREKTRVKRDETVRNVSVTVQETDTDTDTEEDNKAIALSSDPVSEMVDVYHEAMGPAGCPRVLKLTPSRKASALQRLKDCGGMDGWRHAMAKARASPFLTGSNATGWRPGFDFFMQAKSFTKLLEGSYDARNGNHQRQHRPSGGADNILTAIDELFGGGADGGGGAPGLAGFDDAERDATGVYRIPH